MTDLTIFYDGGCPLCAAEMNHLKKRDSNHAIAYEDIYAEGCLLYTSPSPRDS